MQKKNKILKILCLCSVCAIIISIFTVTASANWFDFPLSGEDLSDYRYASSLCPDTVGVALSTNSADGVYYVDCSYTYIDQGINQQGTEYYQYSTTNRFGGVSYLFPNDIEAHYRYRLVSSATYSYVKYYFTDVIYNPSNISYNPRINITFSSPTDVTFIINGTYLDNDNVAREFGFTASYTAGTSVVVCPTIVEAYNSLGLSENTTVNFTNLEVVALPYLDGNSNVDTSFEQFDVYYKPLTPNSLEEDTYYSNLSFAGYKQIINTRNFSDLLDWLGDVMESVLTTQLFVVGNISVTPAILLSTIVGLLLILMVLKFFAGG